MARALSREEIQEWKNKFCPVCREKFGNRYKALQLQAEQQKPIQQIIIEAGREAFDACFGGGAGEGRNVIERFRLALGIRRPTLHDWLDHFFGLVWSDWKRRYICSGHSCSIVETTATDSPKYYCVDKFRQAGICSCPIRGDDLILVDRTPENLVPERLGGLGGTTWVKKLNVISGSHLPLLERQEDDK